MIPPSGNVPIFRIRGGGDEGEEISSVTLHNWCDGSLNLSVIVPNEEPAHLSFMPRGEDDQSQTMSFVAAEGTALETGLDQSSILEESDHGQMLSFVAAEDSVPQTRPDQSFIPAPDKTGLDQSSILEASDHGQMLSFVAAEDSVPQMRPDQSFIPAPEAGLVDDLFSLFDDDETDSEEDESFSECNLVIGDGTESESEERDESKSAQQALFDAMRNMKTPQECRPLLSIIRTTAMSKKAAEKNLCKKITWREWAEAKKHSKFPGPGKPVRKRRFYRQKHNEEKVFGFLEWLHGEDLLQSLSYGYKTISYSNGVHVAIESVKRKQKIREILRQYVTSWCSSYDADSEGVPCQDERCGKKCPKTGIQCMRKDGHHDTKCKFTPDNKLSPSSVERILNQITSGDIKSLRGLDNIVTEKGHDNFNNMKAMVGKLVAVGNLSYEELADADRLMKDIDDSAEFHKIGFPRHLQATGSNHSCTCLKCGFHSEYDPEPCEHCGQHSGLCAECKKSFNLFPDLFELHRKVVDRLKDTDLNDKALEDDLLSWHEDIKNYLRNFYAYRAHVAQREDEGAFDAEFYSNLKPYEAVVIMDYKMKILAASHGEKQADWFSKRGFSCLGALIIFGAPENSADNEVLYHLFISDDTTQDGPAVNCAKHHLYKNILPKYGIKKVHYRCDGAGCFSGHEAKAAFALWPGLTNHMLEEASYKTMVAGCGKTNLDGLFGILARYLVELVDSGASYKNAKELYDLLVQNPLKHTEFHLFSPQRNLIDWEVPSEIEKLSLGSSYLLKTGSKGEIVRKTHSRHGNDTIVQELDFFARVFHGKVDQRELRMKKMSVLEMKFELRLRGQTTSGLQKKDDAMKRLKEVLLESNIDIGEQVEIESASDLKSAEEMKFHLWRCNLPYNGKKKELQKHLQEALQSGIDGNYNGSLVLSADSDVIATKPEDVDPSEHILESTFGMAEVEASLCSKTGWRERVLQRQKNKIEGENTRFEAGIEKEIKMHENAGLFCCNFRHQDTRDRCIATFLSLKQLEKHRQGVDSGISDHVFPAPCMYTKIALDLQQGKCALCFACGSLSNRDSAIAPSYLVSDGGDIPLKQCEDVANMKLGRTHSEVGVYRCDQKAWEKKNFSASDALYIDLEMMIQEGENRGVGEGGKRNAGKYTAEEAVSRLGNMRNPDGRRKYSYREGNQNGPLPTVAYVKAKFSERKRLGAKALERREKSDRFSAMNLEDLKQLFPSQVLSERYVMVQLLEVDDKIKLGGTDGEYDDMEDEALKLECQNRKLPHLVNEEALRMVLRARHLDKQSRVEVIASARLTDGEEIYANACDASF